MHISIWHFSIFCLAILNFSINSFPAHQIMSVTVLLFWLINTGRLNHIGFVFLILLCRYFNDVDFWIELGWTNRLLYKCVNLLMEALSNQQFLNFHLEGKHLLQLFSKYTTLFFSLFINLYGWFLRRSLFPNPYAKNEKGQGQSADHHKAFYWKNEALMVGRVKFSKSLSIILKSLMLRYNHF